MSRIAENISYPKTAYLEMALVFFGANFVYHRNIFRRNLSKFGFVTFMLINAFTSWNIVEAFNPSVIRYYTAAFNNTFEMQHKAAKSQYLKNKIFGFKDIQ